MKAMALTPMIPAVHPVHLTVIVMASWGRVPGSGSGNYGKCKGKGAKIYAEIIGYSATCDAYHVTTPDGESKALTQCMNLAVGQAVDKNSVNYVNAHGTSTPTMINRKPQP